MHELVQKFYDFINSVTFRNYKHVNLDDCVIFQAMKNPKFLNDYFLGSLRLDFIEMCEKDRDAGLKNFKRALRLCLKNALSNVY